MSEKLEDKTIELIDKASNGLDQLTVALAEIGQQYGPDVVDAGLAVARVTAGGSLLYGLFWMLVSAALATVAYKMYKVGKTWSGGKDSDHIDWTDHGMGFTSIFVFVVAGGVGVIGATKLFYIWHWVGVIEPKLWIAHKILNW